MGQGVQYHKFWRRQQDVFDETGDQASWGNWYWATGEFVRSPLKHRPLNPQLIKRQQGTSIEIGSDVNVRGKFLANGTLSGSIDENFRAISNNW